MFLAIVMVAVLVWLLVNSAESRGFVAAGINYWLLGGMVILLIQIFLGTQVREKIDLLAADWPREAWISNVGTDFVLHRSFSWAVLLMISGIWFKLSKTSAKKSLTLTPFLLILSSLLTGIGMAYGGMPAFLQPVHLLLAIITFGWFYQVYLEAKMGRTEEISK